MPKNQQKAKPHRVDFFTRTDDHKCVLLAAMGFSTFHIARETGLTESQVAYRLGKAGMTNSSYGRKAVRNGTSPFAKVLYQAAKDRMDVTLDNYLRNRAGE